MRVIIAGSRNIYDYQLVVRALDEAAVMMDIVPTLVLSGTARGIDQMGEKAAHLAGWEVELYPANWETYGKSAGYVRNVDMAANADALIAIWDGKSKGTKHMIDIARSADLKVYVHHV